LSRKTALVGMGSNIKPEQQLLAAAGEIRECFPQASFSRLYQSRAMGMQGPDFLNACCRFETEMTAALLDGWLKAIEARHKRDRSRGSWVPRTLDLDLLMLDGQVLDADLYNFAYLYLPASELTCLEKVDHGPELPQILSGIHL